MNTPKPAPFDRKISAMPGAQVDIILAYSALYILLIGGLLFCLVGWRILWPIALVLMGVTALSLIPFKKKLRVLSARYPVSLKEKGFIVGPKERFFIPLEFVTDIKFLGYAGRWRYAFEVSYTPAHPELGHSFIFVAPWVLVVSEYKGQYKFRQSILRAVKDRKLQLVQQSGGISGLR